MKLYQIEKYVMSEKHNCSTHVLNTIKKLALKIFSNGRTEDIH